MKARAVGRAGAGNDPRAAKAADARKSRRVSPRIAEWCVSSQPC